MKQTLFSLLCTALLLPQTVFAGIGASDDLLRDVGEGAGAGDIEIQQAVGSGLQLALTIVGTVFLILMIYAGFLWITARGDDSQVDRARKTIVSSVIGLVIVVTSYAFTIFIASIFG